MALLYFEQFNKYASGATGWTDLTNDNPDYTIGGTNPTIVASEGRFGGKVAQWTTVTSRDITVPFAAGAAATNICIVSMCVRLDNGTFTVGQFVELVSCNTTAGGGLRNFRLDVNRGGQLRIIDALGAIVATSGDTTLVIDEWHVVEVKCNMENSGSAVVMVDGAEVINVSGDFLYTAAGPRDYIRLMDGVTYTSLDWFAVMDSSGSYMNDFIGDMKIEDAVPDADGATANWTASAGSNYQCVDDALGAYNDDTDYISSSTTDQDNYVSMGALSGTGASSFLFAFHTALARNDGSGSIALLTNSSATVSASADKTLSTSYAWKRKADLVDPNTSSPWASVGALNSAEWGVRYR